MLAIHWSPVKNIRRIKAAILACGVFLTLILIDAAVKAHDRRYPAYLSLPAGKPVVGRPALLGLASAEGQTRYMLALPLCNRSPHALTVRIKMLDGASEPLYYTSGCTQPSGGEGWVSLRSVPKQRANSIYVYVAWRQGTKTGNETYTIRPQEDNSIR